MTRSRNNHLLAGFLALATALPLTGCTRQPGTGGAPAASATVDERHDPSPAEVDALRKQLTDLDGVTKVSRFAYRKGTFGNGPNIDATFDTDATSRPELVKILESAYRATWNRSDIATGTLIYVVRNPRTGAEAGSSDFGFDTASIGPRELQQLFGPAPSPSPAASPT
jgi:hypothetical protein